MHHLDQGVQYAATAYVELLQAHGVVISTAEVGEATQNGCAERLMRPIKEEEVYLAEYENYADVYQQIGQFLEDMYMHKRVYPKMSFCVQFYGSVTLACFFPSHLRKWLKGLDKGG